MTPLPCPGEGAQGLAPEGTILSQFSVRGGGGPPRPGWGHPQRLWACAWASRSLKESKSCSSHGWFRMHCWTTSSWPRSSAPPSIARVCRELNAELQWEGMGGPRDPLPRERGAGSWTPGSAGRGAGGLDSWSEGGGVFDLHPCVLKRKPGPYRRGSISFSALTEKWFKTRLLLLTWL